MCLRADDTLPCHPRAPEQARRFVVRELSRAASPEGAVPLEWRDLTNDVELIVSELTTNALRARCERLQVHLEVHRTEVIVAVSDDADGWPEERVAAPTDPAGRGLHLVSDVSSKWGTRETETGKQVWAALPVPASCEAWIACER